MKLRQIARNMAELHLNNGIVVLFSYETPVAAVDSYNNIAGRYSVVKTNKKYSRTTTNHINKWFNHEFNSVVTQLYSAFNVKEVDQSILDELGE